jgi:hypothetical protein
VHASIPGDIHQHGRRGALRLTCDRVVMHELRPRRGVEVARRIPQRRAIRDRDEDVACEERQPLAGQALPYGAKV